MKAMYNRDTKNVWIEHDDGSVQQLGTAQTKLDAYDKIGESGYVRFTDWRLSASGSPYREAEIRSAE